ncbi:MAG: flagellar basal body P-ring formation protein FlgA [Maritimibacter sp.]|nr:flagellar basal body P-ring formation protein FlgA [Maritimibacter sp.]
MKSLFLLFLLVSAAPAQAQSVIAARTLRAQTVISAQDVTLSEATIPGAYTALDEVIGLETRVALYAERPVRSGEVGPPALVERNQIVPLIYQTGSLVIQAEGRALDRAGIGETIRVMNLASRQTVSGRIRADGTIAVGSATTTFLAN